MKIDLADAQEAGEGQPQSARPRRTGNHFLQNKVADLLRSVFIIMCGRNVFVDSRSLLSGSYPFALIIGGCVKKATYMDYFLPFNMRKLVSGGGRR